MLQIHTDQIILDQMNQTRVKTPYVDHQDHIDDVYWTLRAILNPYIQQVVDQGKLNEKNHISWINIDYSESE